MPKLFPLVLILLCSHVYGNDSLTAKIDALLSEHIGSNKPGATIGIIDNGVVVFSKGYGMANLAKRQPNRPETSFKIASVSKQFTAAAISLLIEKGQLSLQDDVRKYIPALPDYGKPITVENLLYHTSGIRDYMVIMWLTGKSFEDKFANQDALDIICRQKVLNFTTGHRCVYSNSNYILLAEILRKVTDTSLAEFAWERLFKPLGMTASGFGGAMGAISYRRDNIPFRNDNVAMGDGGMYSTLSDLVTWDRTFYDTAAVSRRLLTSGKLDNGNVLTYGMGIMKGNYKGQPIQTHPGAFLGYRAEMLRFPQKGITIICLGNSEAINPETITRRIADLYIFKEEVAAEIKPAYVKAPASILGKYEVAPDVYIDIKQEEGLLTGKVTGQPEQVLYEDSLHLYRIGTTADKVKFEPNQLTVIQQGRNTVAQKLALVKEDQWKKYAGTYYNAEQDATYTFAVEGGALWFKTGTNPAEKAQILEKYNRLYFSYQNLESATITFDEKVSGFTLSSGRISGLTFVRR